MDNKVVVKSFFWTAIGKYISQAIMFVVSIVMARILMPSDYGIIGIISIFIAISDTLIDSGFTNALINKKECTQTDYSTVFFFNILISCVLFGILYVSAPLIAQFYNMPLLVSTTRTMGLTFVISSLGAVSRTILIKELNFKVNSIISVISSVCSGCIGILLALKNFGIWALVWQSICSTLILVIIQIVYVKWIPSFIFSRSSFIKLFAFGSKLLVSSLIWQIYTKLYNIVIGKIFSPADLAYYTRADGYASLIPGNIGGILQNILFPILSKIQDDNNSLIDLNYKMIKVASAVLFPLCLFLVGAAHPIIVLMITDKWIPVVPLLQILCIGVLFDHIPSINVNFFLAKGQSNVFLKMQTITKPISIILLIATVFINLKAVAWSKAISMFINVGVSFFYLKKLLPISVVKISKDIFPSLLISAILSIILYWYYRETPINYWNLFICSIGYFSFYLAAIHWFDKELFSLLVKLIKRK